jgi:hypothetical protein
MSSTEEDDAKAIFANPYYVVSFADYLFDTQDTPLAREDWVLANAKLIKEMGAKEWLTELLACLATEPSDNPTYMVINPRQTVVFSDELHVEHEPIVDTDIWLEANMKMLKEIGAEEWLWQLLKVLEIVGP